MLDGQSSRAGRDPAPRSTCAWGPGMARAGDERIRARVSHGSHRDSLWEEEVPTPRWGAPPDPGTAAPSDPVPGEETEPEPDPEGDAPASERPVRWRAAVGMLR